MRKRNAVIQIDKEYSKFLNKLIINYFVTDNKGNILLNIVYVIDNRIKAVIFPKI